ncbi:MAG: hypothetical protein LWX51_17585 [Deltaproteobacteria bacterium]|jgi:hypothetical protein|nr:hypothetical protein [Deltaproteobacteria bacterium]
MKNKEHLRRCVVIYNNWISENVDAPVRKALSFRPEELEALFKEIKELMSIIAADQTNIDSLDSKYRSYLKSAILHSLHIQKEEAKRRSQLTPNPEIKKQLERNVEQITELTVGDWFESTKAFDTPRLEEFLLPQQQSTAHIRKELVDDETAISTHSNESMLEMKPNLYGIGVNLPAVWGKIKAWYKRRAKR